MWDLGGRAPSLRQRSPDGHTTRYTPLHPEIAKRLIPYMEKQVAEHARDVPERISDAITGHKTPGIGRKYEHVPMSKKFDAIEKLTVYPLSDDRM